MHYAVSKQNDPKLLRTLIEQSPVAVIAINGRDHPILPQAPLTFRALGGPAGLVDFHLARANAMTDVVVDGLEARIPVNGPHAHISPSWYKGRFPNPTSDRSRTAPTWNYVSATLTGRLEILTAGELDTQIGDLVAQHEPQDGWRYEELDPEVRAAWSDMLLGCRMEIETFDLTAKLSQNQTAGDKPGIAQGLRGREGYGDEAIASPVESFDGTVLSVRDSLQQVAAGHRRR